MCIHPALNDYAGLPVPRQHFPMVSRLAFRHKYSVSDSNSNFKVWIFVINGGIDYVVYDPIPRFLLDADDG
jgi:hypothetical protein